VFRAGLTFTIKRATASDFSYSQQRDRVEIFCESFFVTSKLYRILWRYVSSWSP